jgi:steroid delta-isomerase-like uncharacterized protein
MESSTPLGTRAEPIQSMEWFQLFVVGYRAAWNNHDPQRVASHVAEDITWEDPALPEPARSRSEVADFVAAACTSFPDYSFSEPGRSAISDNRMVGYLPWRMTGTNTGPIDPPGFAPTGRSFSIDGVDILQFRGGLIWRYRALYDFTDLGRQLGLVPTPGSRAERAMVRFQRLAAKVRR